MALQKYRAKRSFDATPEPGDDAAMPDDQLRFVVQEHDASHLHYDFRLENRGVLLSWAVPKGPSLNPDDKRLAMRTEDHPYDYQYFEGVIPKGNYGAGQVIVWDRGTYEVITAKGKSKEDQEKAFRHGLYQGKVSFVLSGEKLRGEFTLVKKSGEDNTWFLIKKADKYSSTKNVIEQEKSVLTGRRVNEVETTAFNWQEWQDCIDKYELPKSEIKTPVKPMLATLLDKPFSDANWLYEIKWDGYRAIAEINKDRVNLYSRNHKNFNATYPRIAEALEQFQVDAIIDGEITMLTDEGKPDFNALQNYDPRNDSSPVYYVFDLLWLDGRAMLDAPLHIRKKFLHKVLPTSPLIRYSDHVEEQGEDFFKLVTAQGIEGVLAKRADSRYYPRERSRDWLKFKAVRRQEAVIGGFTEPRGSRKGIGALILGVYRDGSLEYIGHSGTGLSDRQLTEIRRQLEKLEQEQSPFVEPPKPNAPVHWVKPKLLCEAAFSEWTATGHMRHPKIVGLRTDKPARQVTEEKPLKKEQVLHAEPSNFDFTHRDKVFWPDSGITKGDLIEYYQLITDKIMPYAKDRPVSLLRHPHGIKGSSFFQKDMDQSLPEGFTTFRRYSESNKKDINYFVCNGPGALLYMVQLGCIEINPWNSTTKTPDKPDWLVLDLDPEDIGFEQVVRTALTIKQLLDEIDVTSFIKTSGKRGLHIYLPLHARYDYDQTRQFAELLARLIVKRVPDITSVERSPSKRQGKVYVDFLQNRLGQTLAAPYSVRPTDEATISMPLDWNEITDKLKPTDFTLRNVKTRLQGDDPWQEFFDSHVSIERALKKIEASEHA